VNKSMKKILFIPHHPQVKNGLKIRIPELARPLAPGNTVFLLNWETVSGDYTLANRARSCFKDLMKTERQYADGNLTIVELPTLHRPLSLARCFNRRRVMRFIEDEKIDVVVNGSFELFTMPRERRFRYVYDLADYPPTGLSTLTLDELKNADVCTVISHELADYLQLEHGRKSVVIANGADIAAMRSVRPDEVTELKKRYHVENKWIIGYVGNIGNWVNFELAVEAFRRFQLKVPDSALIWIGPSPFLGELQKKYAGGSVIFTGQVTGSIEPYFKMLDTGLLCHKASPFQDRAFHLKLIEYTAAEKSVVSSPLKESMRLGFPNVLFVEETAEQWTDALLKARNMAWEKEWNALADNYDWKVIGAQLQALI